MGYIGPTPAAVGVTSANITDGAIDNVDIASNAAIALSKTALTAGTGITLDTNTLNIDAAQGQITTVGALDAGSITSGFDSIDVGAGAITTTGALSIASMGTNWTNAGRTVADMGTVTTIDINGGTINGITPLVVVDGGTGASTLTDHGVLLGSGSGAVSATGAGTAGQVLTSGGAGADPAFADAGGTAVATGEYTGDGTTSQAITGLGFQVMYLQVNAKVAGSAASAGYVTYDEVVADASGGGWYWAGNNYVNTGKFVSLDSDGFTVTDGGSNYPPNADTVVYWYVAMGA